MISFVDTSFFFALASADDPDHERVRQVFDQVEPRELPGGWLTTNHVVLETIRLTKRNIGSDAAVEMGRRLYAEQLARIHWTTPAEEGRRSTIWPSTRTSGTARSTASASWRWRTFGIQEALTIDFTHRFIARPGPRPR